MKYFKSLHFIISEPAPTWSWSLLFLDVVLIFSLVSDCMSNISDPGVHTSVYDPVIVR